MNAGTFRTRWAAIGAAVAVTLGAGGIGLISAAPLTTGERPVLVPINCRLADTRPAPDTVGTRNTPIGAAETVTFNAHGTNGNCTIPADATALSLNVTALSVTAPLTFLTLWNADESQPVTSSLNPAAGQPPTPNAVTVDLSPTGQFKLFNALGTLNVIIDVTGYYHDHQHTVADITNEPGIAFTNLDQVVSATTTPTSMVGTSIRVPSDGYVEMHVTGLWLNGSAGEDQAYCQLQKGAVGGINFTEPWIELNDRNTGQSEWLAFSAHRIVPISAADNPFLFNFGQGINLVCDEQTGDVRVAELQISATFFATSYKPIGFIFLPLTADDGTAPAPGDG